MSGQVGSGHRSCTPDSIPVRFGDGNSIDKKFLDETPTRVKCHGLPIKDEWDRQTGREDCANQIETTRGIALYAGPSLCCDACCKEYNHRTRVKECKESWERWMRENAEAYADFSTDHDLFNRAAYEITRKIDVSKNVILFGPTGTGKTFLMLQHLKRAMWFGKAPVRVMWSDQIKRITRGQYSWRDIQPYQDAGILGIEELFGEDSARESYMSFIRDIIDVRLRLRRPTIITTQLKAQDVEGEVNKFENATRADTERRDAILRRIKQRFTAVNTDLNFDHENYDSIF